MSDLEREEKQHEFFIKLVDEINNLLNESVKEMVKYKRLTNAEACAVRMAAIQMVSASCLSHKIHATQETRLHCIAEFMSHIEEMIHFGERENIFNFKRLET